MNGDKQKLTLDRPASYHISVPGILEELWTAWFEGMTVMVDSDDDGSPISALTGTFDQAALLG